MEVFSFFWRWFMFSFLGVFQNLFISRGIKFNKILLLSLLLPYMLTAATESITDDTSTAIEDRSCFEKTFDISLLASITKVTIEVNLDHTFRADLDIYLTSPADTEVILTTDNGSGSDNLYVIFKDDASTSITSDSDTHTTVVERSPEGSLSDFNDENSQGTWTLKICDDAGRDEGTYSYATLTIEGNLLSIAVDDNYTVESGDTLYASSVKENDIGDFYISEVTEDSSGGTLDFNNDDGTFTFTPDGTAETYTFTYEITDNDSGKTDTATVTIHITGLLIAKDDTYSTDMDTPISDNIISNDTQTDATVSDHTEPSNGTLEIASDGNFTYTPDSGWSGTDTFTYTLTDPKGQTSTATVTITVAASYTEGSVLPFSLVNPPQSRNIVGNYAIAGNTVLCLTEKTDGYGGTCQGDNEDYVDKTSNNYVSMYLDIDSQTETWNSTSSYIELPDTYDKDQNIVWAGLFWQGRVSWDKEYYIHYAHSSSDISYSIEEVGKGTSVEDIVVADIGATQIKLKIDDGDYHTVEANRFHTYESSDGQTYAAVSDVTSILRDAALEKGKHVFTVANLLTMEGREGSPGAYGGWSIVVVYGENVLTSKPRNISIYNGFISIGSDDDPIKISGFKLPATGPINAQLSVFSGEGEYLYGRTDRSSSKDNIKISNEEDGEYDYLPGCSSGTDLGNCDNIFDGSLTGILRDHITGKYNDQSVNNVGVDVDTFDVSSLMEEYRDDNPDINATYIKTYSNNDYVTPSMIAFSAELYKPSVCYDYTIQQDGFDITSEDRNITTVGEGDLSINIAIQSEEGDFDFDYSTLGIRLIPTTDTSFVDALYAPNNVNTMIPAIYANDHTELHPRIAIGENVTSDGGTIEKLQRYFAEFNYHMDTDHYTGRFELELNTTVNYGSGAVPIIQSTENESIPRCPQSNYYNPLRGSFNVERHNSSGDETEKYPLYTQIVGKDFDFDVVAYQEEPSPPYSTEVVLDGYTVDIELINARPFNDANSTFVCNNPNPKIIQTLNADGDKHLFASFDNSSRVDMSPMNIQTDTALRNAAFRIWYIVDANNTIVPYTSSDPSDNAYFQDIYDTYLKEDDTTLQASGTHGFCTVETLGDGGCSSYVNAELETSGCYACMRDFFSKAVCSRDNFSIRPVAYRVSISDSNESTTPIETISLGNNSILGEDAVARVAAGYQYKIDGNATSYISDQTIALGYTRNFDNTATEDLSSLLHFKDQSDCFDQNTTAWNISFINSVITGIVQNDDVNLSAGNLIKHSNAGKYAYAIHDSNWTIVDQQRYPYKTFPDVDDCIPEDNSIATDSTSQSGCDIDTKLIDNTGLNTPVYNDLYLQYEPYKFDLSDINFSTNPTNQEYLFMTDFDDPYYSDSASLSNPMAASYEGNITALSKDDKITTNFTDGCAASALSIHLSRESNASESELYAQFGIVMQQYLQYGSDVDLQTSFDDMQTGEDANLTLAAEAFEDTVQPGSAKIRIYTTFKKPAKNDIQDGSEGINPIIVNYLDINATSKESNSSANLTTHIPKGTQDHDHNITFLYSKITPDEMLYTTEDESVTTPLNIIVYCSYGPAICQNIDLDTGINVSHETSNWYLASNLFSSTSDLGTSDLNISYYSGKTPGDAELELDDTMPKAKELTGVGYELDGRQNNLIVSLPSSDPRPVTVEIKYHSVPWLNYDPSLEYYRVRFIPKPTAWTGHGKTGHVVEDDISTTKTLRLEW